MLNKINILVVDDSAFMRKSLTLLLESDPNIKVIDTASDGLDAIEKVKKLKPDIVTMDIEMPRMDGLESLEIIMKECPTPVIMVSSLTIEGAEITLKALDLGAVDFIPKEMSFVSVSITSIKDELISKVKSICINKSVISRVNKLNSSIQQDSKKTSSLIQNLPRINYRALAIGISTGGPISLQKLVKFSQSRI